MKMRVVNFVIRSSQTKSILLGFLAVLMLGVGAWRLYVFYSKPKFEPIIFSNQEYLGYRKQIALLINQEFECVNVYPSDLGIALVDLNDDGTEEVIVYSLASGISGAGGGFTRIYHHTKSGLSLLWTRSLTDGRLSKSTHKTNGYHDIVSYVIGWDPLDKSKDQKHTLAWTGKGYDYISSQGVSNQERKMFTHENL
jgi:hypothetical protein